MHPLHPLSPPHPLNPLHLLHPFANVQGDIDTALGFDEFVESLMRVALSAWQDDQTVLAPWQKMRKVRQ